MLQEWRTHLEVLSGWVICAWLALMNRKLMKEHREQSLRERALIPDVKRGFEALNPRRRDGVRSADLYIGSC